MFQGRAGRAPTALRAPQVPLLLRRGTFCDAYVAQARVFRTYSSWVLAMLLSKVRAPYPALP